MAMDERRNHDDLSEELENRFTATEDEDIDEIDDPEQLKRIVRNLLRIMSGVAADEPPPFRGRPRPGGTMDKRRALDAKAPWDRGFADRFPEAAGIATDGMRGVL